MPTNQNKKSGWKVVQNKNKVKKKTKLALIVLGIIMLVIFAGNLVRFTQTLFSPWKLYPVYAKGYIWNGEFNINLVVKKNFSVYVVSYNPKEKKLILLNIPETVLVEVPGGFGKWQLRSVYNLGESDKKGDGLAFLKQAVSTLLGIPVDGFLETENLDELLQRNLFISFIQIPSIKTDLTLWELIKFKIGASQVRFDKVERLDLLQVLDKGNLADGTQIYIADPVKVDSISASFADPVIKSEHKTIAIFNATEKGGLAQIASRIISNMGGNVIIVSNASQIQDASFVSGEESVTLERMKQLFNLNCKANREECDKIKSKDEDYESRAQINIILGKDFAKI